MGSCFRSRKKNSYTVTQMDEEYRPVRGKYQSKTDRKLAAESHMTQQSNIIDKPSQNVHVSNTSNVELEVKTKEVTVINQTNGNVQIQSEVTEIRRDDILIDSSDVEVVTEVKAERRPSESSTVSVKSDKVSVDTPIVDVQVSSGEDIRTEVTYQYQEESREVDTYTSETSEQREPSISELAPEPEAEVEEPPLSDHEPEIEETTTVVVMETPVAESQVTFKDTPETIPSYSSTEYTEGGHYDDYNDSMREESAGEGYTTITTTTTTSGGQDYDQYDDTDVTQTTTVVTTTTVTHVEGDEGYEHQSSPQVQSGDLYDEVQITDSPAGTWDARLNTDVRAELEDVRRSLESSRASSTASLNDQEKSTTVHFETPEYQNTNSYEYTTDQATSGGTEVTVTTTTVTTESQPENEYPTVDTDNMENEHMERLASEYEFVGFSQGGGAGEIVLTEQHEVTYDEPYPGNTYQENTDLTF